ncbi:hypothetical protein L1887_14877 [Cichorium endivia]|nr:hypothetical protein L1887_14877 [Cichorium endivia]
MLDGRVKTLHPNVHGGILSRRDQSHHMEALDKHNISISELVVVNLYPFYEKVTSTNGITFDDGIQNIDIGGPTMISAAAKAACFYIYISNNDFLINGFRFP